MRTRTTHATLHACNTERLQDFSNPHGRFWCMLYLTATHNLRPAPPRQVHLRVCSGPANQEGAQHARTAAERLPGDVVNPLRLRPSRWRWGERRQPAGEAAKVVDDVSRRQARRDPFQYAPRHARGPAARGLTTAHGGDGGEAGLNESARASRAPCVEHGRPGSAPLHASRFERGATPS